MILNTMIKPRKPSRKKLIDRLDDLVRKIVRLREPNFCVCCGTSEGLTLGHIFSRRHFATRWDIESDGNCHLQCFGCNVKHNSNAWPYLSWYIKNHGQDKLDLLEERYREVRPLKDFQLQIMIDEYRSILKTLEAQK